MSADATSRLARARGGDDRAFGELADPYLGELRVHCYRMLGSVQDAEDILQETLLAAWKGLGQYEGRALAFVTAAQHLPPRQRAVLMLRDVLGFRAGEVAGMLETSEASVNSALQRARATMAGRLPGPGRERAPLPRSAPERDLASRFATAFAEGDVDAVVAMLTEDAWFTMPPATLEYQGWPAIREFLRESMARRGGRGYRLVPVRANGQVAFGCYTPDGDGYRAHGTMVLTMEGDRIAALTRFVENGVMRWFGLPLEVGAGELEGLG